VKLAPLTEGPDTVNGKRPRNNMEIFNFVLVCNTNQRGGPTKILLTFGLM